MARDAARQLQEPAQQRLLAAPEQGHVDAALGAAQRREQRDLVQLVALRIARARILQIRKARPKPLHAALLRTTKAAAHQAHAKSKRFYKSLMRFPWLPIPETGQAVYWDSDLTGFGRRISGRGTRTYFVHKRLPDGRQVKVGRHGTTMTAEAARIRAKRLLGAIDAGDDPAAERRAAREVERERRGAPTVAALLERREDNSEQDIHVTVTIESPGEAAKIINGHAE